MKQFLLPALILIFLMHSGHLPGQSQVHPSHSFPKDIPGSLPYPWTGGVNSCQFCPIDLDLDGCNDLLLFDRHGNRKMTFLQSCIPGNSGFRHYPAAGTKLPVLHDWVITADYDGDGRMDIFTYGNGGIRVFRNLSDTSLRFLQVTGLLESFYYTGKVGILVTSVDYPAIADLDGDGDLDILTFFGLGSYVEYHRNMSVERYGHSDSLDYRLEDNCWGKFKESETGNRIILNADCPQQAPALTSAWLKDRHTGSTLLALDLDTEGGMDLVLGDYDYPGLTAILNGGTPDSAFMTAQDTSFPSVVKPARLFSFPAAFQVDVDLDGRKDLLISPFDPALFTSENDRCIWYYRNSGTAGSPSFEFVSNDFIRNGMLDFGSGSRPVLYDFDGDGLADLLIGNEGYYDSSWYYQGTLRSSFTSRIAYLRNTGTPGSPRFTWITGDLGSLSVLGLRGIHPAMADIDGDGLTDLVAGSSDGRLIYLRQTPSGGAIPQFEPPVMNWQSIDVGDYSSPQFFDLDSDQVPELVIGEKNGNINLYRSSGPLPDGRFSVVTDSLGKINVTNPMISYYGFSIPWFFRGTDGTTSLLAGSEEGKIWYYPEVPGDPYSRFIESDTLYQWLAPGRNDTLFGWNSSPTAASLTHPQSIDLITGNFSGGLNFVSGAPAPEVIPGISFMAPAISDKMTIRPNPADQFATISLDFPPYSLPREIQVFSLVGILIQTIPASPETVLHTGHLPNGCYIIRCGIAGARLIVSRP